ncbi:hypothetical protein [Nocardia sp. NPDC127526]|uniref:hypothetical protein n=1 Tax=Nocardia sp. NPDC127526 TaxID=3345393 RepID=UPI00362D4796
MSVRKSTAAALALGALFAPVIMAAGPAQAAPIQGSCSGGQVTMNTSPIGMGESPITAHIDGQLTGCSGTPGQSARVVGDFQGAGSCFDVNGNVNGQLLWDNGEISNISGPYHVAGGPTPPPSTNTVPLAEGGALTITQAGPDSGAVTGPCMEGSARQLNVPVLAASFG